MPIGENPDGMSRDGHFFCDKLAGGAVNDNISVFDLESLDGNVISSCCVDFKLEHTGESEASSGSDLFACADAELQIGHDSFFLPHQQPMRGHRAEGAEIDRTVDDEFEAGVESDEAITRIVGFLVLVQ